MTKKRDQVIHPESLNDVINYIIYRTARILKMKFRRDMEDVGMNLTQEQYFIMFKLWQKDGQSQTELSDDIFRDNPNITRLLDNLEKKKYVQRIPDNADRRMFRICLTDKGKKLRQIYLKYAPVSRKGDYLTLTVDDLENLKRILRTIESNITNQIKAARHLKDKARTVARAGVSTGKNRGV